MVNLGIVKPGSTILIPFHAFDSNDPSASVTITGLALADIGIYKGTSMTERASTTGVVLLDTDGIDIDATTGIHGLSIDLSSNATADFYNVGSNYYVTIASITVDAATVNFVAATFTIGYPGAIQETNIATLASQTSFTLDEGSADDDAYIGCPVYVHDIASAVQVAFGYVSDYTGSTKTVTLAADPGIFTMAAGDNISFFPPSNVQAVAGTTQTAGDLATLVTTVDTVVDGIQTDLSNGTDGLGAIKAETALIVADTNELQTDDVPGLIATAQTDLDTITGAAGALLDTTATSPQLVDDVWDEVLTGSSHNIATSAGKRLRQVQQAFVHASGTIATVTDGHTFTLDTGAVATADYYTGDRLQIVEGAGAGQSRVIVAYSVGRVAILDSNFTTNPDTSSLYEVVAADVHVAVSDSDLAEGFVATYTNTTTITLDTGAVGTTDYYVGQLIIFTHGTGAGQAREVTAYTSGRVVTMSPALVTALDTTTTYHIQAAVSIPEIVDEVWDEVLTGATHDVSTSSGRRLRKLNEGLVSIDSAVDDPGAAATTTVFNTDLTEVDDFWNDSIMVFTSGALTGQARPILDFANINGQITLDEVLTSAPGNNDGFIIVAMHSHPVSQIADSVWDEDATGHQTGGTFGQAIGDPGANAETMYDAVVTDAAGTNVAADIVAVKAETAAIVNDTDLIDDGTSGLAKIATDVAAVLVDTGTTLQGELDGIQADTEDIQTRLPAALVSGKMDSDVEAINDSAPAAVNLGKSALQIISGAAEGTPSTTVIQTDLAETSDDIYIGRTIIFTSGAAKDEASDITDYTGATGTVTVTALSNAPSVGNTFIII